MGDVDLANQRIMYYNPSPRCGCNWLSLMIQILSIIPSNAYVSYIAVNQYIATTHKRFTLDIIALLRFSLKHSFLMYDYGRRTMNL